MEEKLKIFLCEDDENLGMLLREYLQAKGFDTDLFPDGEAGFKGFVKTKYDLCIVDVMMPKKDGVTLVKEIRQINSEIPVIFLTAKNMKEDVLEGFKAGADDYITKPFSMEELVLRIEAIIRRVKGKKSKEQQVYSFGSMMFDTQKQILTIGDIQTKLTTKESELLSLLCAHANDILERNHALHTYKKYLTHNTRLRSKNRDYTFRQNISKCYKLLTHYLSRFIYISTPVELHPYK